MSGRAKTVREIAKPEEVTPTYVSRLTNVGGEQVMNSCSELFKFLQITPLTNGQSCHWYAADAYTLDGYGRQSYSLAKQRDQP